MKKAICALLLILSYGCAPAMLSSNRATSYTGKISNLSVLISEPGKLRTSGSDGFVTSPASSQIIAAMSDLIDVLRRDLASYFSSHGLPAEAVAASDGDSRQYSHRLVVTPFSGSGSCYYGKCHAIVQVSATLQDLASKEIVWSGTFEVPRASSPETPANVGALLLGRFRSEKLVVIAAN